MNTTKTVRLVLLNIVTTILTVTVIAAVLLSGSRALAQNPAPDGPVAPIPAGGASSPSQGDGLKEVNVPAFAMGSGGDGLPDGTSPAKSPAATLGPDSPAGALVSFSYYRLIGTAFNIRTSTTTFAYNFNGCIYQTAGTDNRYMAPLLIPNNSIIKYLRLYYDDTSATDMTAWITRYEPGLSSTDLTSVTSTGAAGYGTTLSPEITQTVNLVNYAYTIIFAPSASGVAQSFCGVRVAYYAPTFSAVALPIISNNH
jgi:hypothetical protein